MNLFARTLAAVSLLHVAAMWIPPVTWGVWMVRFGALELAPLAAITGVAAIAATSEPWVRALGLVGVVAGLLPALWITPIYLREGAGFSPTRWLGAPEPTATRTVDVPFGDGLVADVYRPPGPGPHPWVILVHGGSWRAGDKGDLPHQAHALALAGYVVVDLRYRLAPFPAAIEDVRKAIVEVHARASELDLDPDRGALLGRSAGGQIALVAAYAPAEAFAPAAPPVRAVVAIYAPTDLAWDHANPYVPDVVDGTSALEAYLGGTPSQSAETYRRATPMTWVDGPVPATLLVHGTAERCVRPVNAERLRDALVAHGQAARTLFVPFADHGFDVRRGGLGEQLARHVVLDFLGRALPAAGAAPTAP